MARNIALAFANRIADPRSAAEHRQLIVSSLDAAVELAAGYSDTGKLMQARNAARERVEQCKAAAQDWAKRPM